MELHRRFYETEKMFERRVQIERAREIVADEKMWRVTAIEMKKSGDAYTMGKLDHFTVKAHGVEAAIGRFKIKNGVSNWFVIGVEPETITA